MSACRFCGDEQFAAPTFIPANGDSIEWEACCTDYANELAWEMEDWTREEWADFIGWPIRRVYGDGLVDEGMLDWSVDVGLELAELDLATARAFVAKHHRHNGPPVGWRWGHAVYNGPELVGVAMVGRPVARMLNDGETVEVNRLCINPELPPEAVEHAASKLYGAAAREAKRRGYARILTYTLESEPGTSLRAAGWTPTHRTRGESWDRPSRRRTDKAPTTRKLRWERQLRPGRQLTLKLGVA